MRVAIIGKGMGWWNYKKHKHTFDEIWSINSQFFYMGGDCTKVFEMHDFEWSLDDVTKHIRLMSNGASEDEIVNHAMVVHNLFPTKIATINKLELPLYSVKQYDSIPTSFEYPKKSVVSEVCHGRDFITTTVAAAIAYAIFTFYKTIHFYGVSTDDGRTNQHPSVAYLIGIAEERGIEVNIDRSGGSQILASDFNYGYIETYP